MGEDFECRVFGDTFIFDLQFPWSFPGIARMVSCFIFRRLVPLGEGVLIERCVSEIILGGGSCRPSRVRPEICVSYDAMRYFGNPFLVGCGVV